jgi:DNA-binding NtrC family response regulator
MELKDIKARYNIVGRDEKLNRALETAIKVAKTDLSVLIQGESGVGKEVIPRIIHDNSLRKNKRYVAINCGSIPEGTIDSELFGHEKGSYTGAIAEREGYFGAADGGTLFLDEVGELPMTTQARLLRVLETGEYIRVGSDTPRKTNVRIVAATNVDIPKAIREGHFRQDLYYRLCTINIQMPPLRERGIDSVLLFKMFAMLTASKYHIPEPIRLTAEGEQVLMGYKWPGNIRELKNVVEQMSILERGIQITPDILYKYDIIAGKGARYDVVVTDHTNDGPKGDMEKQISFLLSAVINLRKEVDDLKLHIYGEHAHAPTVVSPPMLEGPVVIHRTYGEKESGTQIIPTVVDTVVTHGTPPLHTNTHHHIDDIVEVEEEESLNLAEIEKKYIIKALEKHRHNRKKAADELKISERTLYRKIQEYNLDI